MAPGFKFTKICSHYYVFIPPDKGHEQKRSMAGSLLGMRAFLRGWGMPWAGDLPGVMKRPQETPGMDAFQSRGRPNEGP